ncbi:MAG: 50S ribosomal protein L35 [Candidatus Spechtbacterales bacterium]
MARITKQKLKTKKAVAKRFKITAKGKVMRRRAGISHLNAKQSGAQRREKRKWSRVSKAEENKLKKLLPYS